MLVRELLTKIGFDLDDKAIKRAEVGLAGVKNAALGLGAIFTGVAAGILGLAMNAAHAGDEVIKGAQKVGLSTDAYQKLGYAAQLADLEQGELNMGLVLLSKRMVAAAEGTKGAGDEFKKLGVKFKDSTGKLRSSDQVLIDLADRFQKMPDGAEKTALALEFFGKSGAKMIPLLNGGGQAIRDLGEELDTFGGVITKDGAKASEEFNDNITRVKRIVVSLKNALGIALVPIIRDVIEDFLDWAKANKEVIRSKIKEYAEGLGHAFLSVVEVGKELVKGLEWIVDLVGGIGNAVKIAAGAFAVFTGAKVVISLYEVATALGAVIAGIFGVELAALAVPALIIAAILAVAAGIYLIYDDIVAFIEGRPSLFAPIYEKVGPIIDSLKAAWTSFVDFFKNLWVVLKADVFPLIAQIAEILIYPYKQMIQPIITAMSWIGQLIAKLYEFLGIGEKVAAVWEKIKGFGGKAFDFAVNAVGDNFQRQIDGLKSVADFVNNRAGQIQSGDTTLPQKLGTEQLTSMLNGGVNAPPGRPGAGADVMNNQNNDFQINQKVEVNVQSTADPKDIANQTQSAVGDEMKKAIREASRALEPGAVT